MTVVLYLVVRRRLDRQEGTRSTFGRFDLPVAVAALVWIVVAMFVLIVPAEAFVPDMIVVGLIAAGGLYFFGMLIFNPGVLEAERETVAVKLPLGVSESILASALRRFVDRERTSLPTTPSTTMIAIIGNTRVQNQNAAKTQPTTISAFPSPRAWGRFQSPAASTNAPARQRTTPTITSTVSSSSPSENPITTTNPNNINAGHGRDWSPPSLPEYLRHPRPPPLRAGTQLGPLGSSPDALTGPQ